MKFKGTTGSKILITLSIILIVFLGLVLGFLAADLYTNYIAQKKDITRTQLEENARQVSAEDIFLEENADIIFNRVYTKCNELSTETKVADSSNIGKTEQELKAIYRDWNIEEFSSGRLVMQKTIDSYSPKYYKLGVYNNEDNLDMVAVYTYDIEGNEILDRVTGTPLELIFDNQRTELEEGIMVDNEEDLFHLLENYDE